MSEPPVVEQSFDTLCDAITWVFRQEQTSLLSLDRICQVLQSPNLYINFKRQGLVPCSSIIRRRISSTLSSSELFVRAGPPRVCLWAIRPNNPLFLSDGVISASIEQMLTNNGPMTLEQFVNQTTLNGVDINLFERFLNEHESEFSRGEDGTYWFTGQPRPIQRDFESIIHALVAAFRVFPQGASVEELTWYLSMATVGGPKSITRRSVSRELSRRTDLFNHLSRARYILNDGGKVGPETMLMPEPVVQVMAPPPPQQDVPVPFQPVPPPQSPPFRFFDDDIGVPAPHHDEDDFDPFNFFSTDFQFSFE